MTLATKFTWTCPSCSTKQTDEIDVCDGPFLSCTCDGCGKSFDQETVAPEYSDNYDVKDTGDAWTGGFAKNH